MNLKKLNVGIIDRSQFIHDGLNAICANASNSYTINFSSFNYSEYDFIKASGEIDILILDVFHDLDIGLEICKTIRNKFPLIKILAYSYYSELTTIAKIFQSGVQCYLEKTEGFNSILKAFNQLASVGYHYKYDLSIILNSNTPNQTDKKKTIIPTFSEREMTIIELVQKEFTTKEIAAHLGLHIKTIEKHKSNMMLKTDSKKILGVILFMQTHDILPSANS